MTPCDYVVHTQNKKAVPGPKNLWQERCSLFPPLPQTRMINFHLSALAELSVKNPVALMLSINGLRVLICDMWVVIVLREMICCESENLQLLLVKVFENLKHEALVKMPSFVFYYMKITFSPLCSILS